MTTTIDTSLDVTGEASISLSVRIAARGEQWQRVFDLPDSLTISASQRSTPTVTITASWISPGFNWSDLTPAEGRLSAIMFNLTTSWHGQESRSIPVVGWVSDVQSTRNADGHVVTVTMHSADWIIQQHTISETVSVRETFRENPDAAWREWFTVERLGLAFSEFVELHTMADDSTTTGTITVPIAGGSSLWDVASSIALGMSNRFVAGISHPAEETDTYTVTDTLDYAVPAINLPTFARDDLPAIDLRSSQGRVIEEILSSPGDWADIIVHNRRQIDRTETDASMVETTTRYGDTTATSDLRTEAVHTSWATREQPGPFADMLARERSKKWAVTITTQIDPRIWLGTGCLTDQGDLWVSGVTIDIASATMRLELAPQQAQIVLTTWQQIQPATGRTWQTMTGPTWAQIGL